MAKHYYMDLQTFIQLAVCPLLYSWSVGVRKALLEGRPYAGQRIWEMSPVLLNNSEGVLFSTVA